MKTRKGLVGLLGSAGIALASVFGNGEKVSADGYLRIENKVSGYISTNQLKLFHYDKPNITDGYDSAWDADFPGIIGNGSGLVSDLNKISQSNYNLMHDYRLNSSVTPYYLELLFNGSTSQNLENHLELAMPSVGWTFSTQPLRLQQADALGNRFGTQYDVRKVIDGTWAGTVNPSPGILILNPLPAGDYNVGLTSPFNSYSHFVFDFQPITNHLAQWTDSLGNGKWPYETNWNGGAPGLSGLLGDTATFNQPITTTTNISLDNPANISALHFDGTGATKSYVINGTNALTLQASPGNHALIDLVNASPDNYIISAPMNINSPLDIITNSGSLTLAGNLNVAPGTIVSKTGSGSLIISGPQSYGSGSVLQFGSSYPLSPEMMNYSANNSSNNVPEPSTYALLAGAGLAGAVGWAIRNSRRKYTGIGLEDRFD